MVRKSPNKVRKARPAPTGSSSVPSSTSMDPALAPKLDPVDRSADSSEPWSPTKPSLRSPAKPQGNQVAALQQEKDTAENKLWDAMIDLQKHEHQKQQDEELLARLQAELAKLKTDHERDLQNLEELKTHNFKLESSLHSAQDQATLEKKQTLEKLESRDEYIARLQDQVDTLNATLASLKNVSEVPASVPPLEIEEGDASQSWSNDTTVDQSFNSMIVPQTPGSNDMLASLARQKRQQKVLRNTVNKQRIELFNLRKQLAELNGSPVPDMESADDSDVDEDVDEARDASASANNTIDDSQILGRSSVSYSEEEEPRLEISASHGFSLSDELTEHANDRSVALAPSQTRAHPSTPDGSVAPVVPAALYDQAREFNHTLIPTAKYEALSSQALNTASAAIHPPSVDFTELKRLAAQLNYSVLSNEEYEDINKLLHGKKPAREGVRSHVLEDLVRQNTFELRNPSKINEAWIASREAPDVVKEYADRHNLALIPNAVSAATELASRLGLAVSPKKQTPSNTSEDISPMSPRTPYATAWGQFVSQNELASAAAALGLTVVPVKKFEKLQQDLSKLRSNDAVPSAAEVAKLAKRAGLQVIPVNPTLDELQQVVNDEVVLIEKETYEALENPGPATLTRLAKGHQLAVVPQNELDKLRGLKAQAKTKSAQAVEPLHANSSNADDADKFASSASAGVSGNSTQEVSVDALRATAERLNMVVLSPADYQQIIKTRSSHDFSHLPMSQRTKYFEELIQSHSNQTSPSSRQSPVSSSLGSMEDRARRMGFVLVTPEEYQSLKQSQMVYEPTKADVIQSAKKHGLATMPTDEFSALRARKWKEATHEHTSNLAAASRASPPGNEVAEEDPDLKAVPAIYLETLQRIVETPTRQDIEALASKLNLYVDDSESLEKKLNTRIEQLNLVPALSDDEKRANWKALGLVEPLSNDEIMNRALKLGLQHRLSESEIKAAAKSLGLIEPPTDAKIIALAKELGLAEPLTDDQIKMRAHGLGLIEPLTDDQILERARLLGLTDPVQDHEIRDRAKGLGLIEPLSTAEIEAEATELGYIKAPSQDEVKAHAKKLGLVEPILDEDVKQRALSLGLVHPLSQDEIKARARKLGLTDALSDSEIRSKAKDFGLVEPLTNADIRTRAQELGMVQRYTDDEIRESAKTLGLVEPLSDADIVARAKNLGLVRPLTSDQLRAHAHDLGLREPLSEMDIKAKSKELGLVDPPSDDEISARAKDLGLIDPLTESEVKEKAKSFGLVEPFSADELKKEAKALGLVEPLNEIQIREKAMALGLAKPLKDNEIKEKAKSLGLVEPLSDNEIKERAQRMGLAEPLKDNEIREKAQALGLVEPLKDSEIKEKALALGLAQPLKDSDIKEKAKVLGLVEPLSESEIKNKALDLGLARPLKNNEIREKAKALGLIEPLKDNEIKEKAKALGLVEPLSHKELRQKAKALGFAEPLKDNEIREKAKALGLVEPLRDSEIKEKAMALGLAQPLKDSEIKERAKVLGLIEPLNDDELKDKARALGFAEPLKDNEIREKAKALGLVEPLRDSEIKEKAMALGLAQPLKDSEIKERAKVLGLIEPLNDDELKDKARALGLAEPLKDNEIREKAKALGLVEPLRDSEVKKKAKALGLIEPLSHNELKAKARALGLAEPLKDNEIREKAKALGLVEPLKDNEIREKAKALGLVEPVKDSEIRERAQNLGLAKPLNDNEIREKAKALGLVEPLKDTEIREKAKALGLVEPVKDPEIKERAKALGLVEPLKDSETKDKAKALGLVEPLNDSGIKKEAKKLGLIEPLTDSDVVLRAKLLGYELPLSDTEFKERARSLGLFEPLSIDAIIAKAKDHGLVLPPSDTQIKETAKSMGLVEPPSDHDIVQKAEAFGLQKPLTESQVLERAKSLGLEEPLSDNEIRAEARKLGLITPFSDDEIKAKAKTLGLEEALNVDEIKERAKKLGLLDTIEALAYAKSAGLVEPPSQENIKQTASKLGMVAPPSVDEVLAKAKTLGLTAPLSDDEVIAKAKALGLVAPLSEEEIKTKALAMGLVRPLSNEEVIKRAEELSPSQTRLTQSKLSELAPHPSDEQVLQRGKSLGLVEPTSNEAILAKARALEIVDPYEHENGPEYEHEHNSHKHFSTDSSADSLSHPPSGIDLHRKPLNGFSGASSEDERNPWDNEEASVSAHASHLRQLSEDIFITADRPSESAAAAIGPRRLPHSRGKINLAEAISNANSSALAVESEGVQEREYQAGRDPSSTTQASTTATTAGNVDSAIKGGDMISMQNNSAQQSLATTAAATTRGNVNTSSGHRRLNSIGLPESVNTAATPSRRAVRRYEVHGTRTPMRTTNIPRSNTSASLQARLNDTLASGVYATQRRQHSRANSVSTSSGIEIPATMSLNPPPPVSKEAGTTMGLSSLSSQASISNIPEERIESLLSQVMVGEVLYKYYGGLNFEGITGGRHRRYFWFRPESRSLHWFRENPHLFGNASAKHITVTGIEDVVDRNPLPAGLHHRSLVISGQERDVRVTCTTPGRHLVWLAAIKSTLNQ